MNCKANNLQQTNQQNKKEKNTPDEQKYNNGDLDLVIEQEEFVSFFVWILAILATLAPAAERIAGQVPLNRFHPLLPSISIEHFRAGDSGGSIFDRLLLLVAIHSPIGKMRNAKLYLHNPYLSPASETRHTAPEIDAFAPIQRAEERTYLYRKDTKLLGAPEQRTTSWLVG